VQTAHTKQKPQRRFLAKLCFGFMTEIIRVDQDFRQPLMPATFILFELAVCSAFDQFDARSIGDARNARESQVYRDQFLASIKERLGTAAVKRRALDLCQELFVADGARSDEEDAVLQNLRTLLQ
jgi:hypothetical protein